MPHPQRPPRPPLSVRWADRARTRPANRVAQSVAFRAVPLAAWVSLGLLRGVADVGPPFLRTAERWSVVWTNPRPPVTHRLPPGHPGCVQPWTAVPPATLNIVYRFLRAHRSPALWARLRSGIAGVCGDPPPCRLLRGGLSPRWLQVHSPTSTGTCFGHTALRQKARRLCVGWGCGANTAPWVAAGAVPSPAQCLLGPRGVMGTCGVRRTLRALGTSCLSLGLGLSLWGGSGPWCLRRPFSESVLVWGELGGSRVQA